MSNPFKQHLKDPPAKGEVNLPTMRTLLCDANALDRRILPMEQGSARWRPHGMPQSAEDEHGRRVLRVLALVIPMSILVGIVAAHFTG